MDNLKPVALRFVSPGCAGFFVWQTNTDPEPCLKRRIAEMRKFSLSTGAIMLFIVSVCVGIANAGVVNTWLPGKKLAFNVAAGEQREVIVSFVTATNLSDVTFSISSDLEPYVTILPDPIPFIEAGTTTDLSLVFSVPASAQPLDVYKGTIHIRKGSGGTLPQVLKLALHVGIGDAGGEVTSENGEATLTIPPGAITTEEPLLLSVETAPDGVLDPPWGTIFGTIYDLGPSGTIFAEPLILAIRYDLLEIPPVVGSM